MASKWPEGLRVGEVSSGRAASCLQTASTWLLAFPKKVARLLGSQRAAQGDERAEIRSSGPPPSPTLPPRIRLPART